ncbi:hypothetical protein F3J23_10760 [Chryseobacterium sp. Tr-659]|uniref:hypothetical protein n=1 Tax=Chryseobacterium sp. Tr-659 TaxID=2608340 RepID=UPI00141FDD0C|nr:hypothetical protein [Chryseobacterium sp. Tr-659]NIF05922.1 hypothetical protein [Chryseobacterium sp. Tr-659]
MSIIPSVTWKKVPYLSIRGLARIFGTKYTQLSQQELTNFNQTIFNKGDVPPKLIPSLFDDNKDLLKYQLPKFMNDFIPRTYQAHVAANKDLNSPDAKRSVYAATDRTDDGHSIISVSFQSNIKTKEAVIDPGYFIHTLSNFPAGGGVLVPTSSLVDVIYGSRQLKKFDFSKVDELWPSLQQYQAKIFRSKDLLTNNTVLLGQNAVYFTDHLILPETETGSSMQIARPQTILPHNFDGQGLWIASSHPELPNDTIALCFIGHGKSNSSLGEITNNTFAPSVFQLSFRSGNISYLAFDELKNSIGPDADMLCMNPQYNSDICGRLVEEDFMYRINLPLLITMDYTGGKAMRLRREQLGPNTCPVPPDTKNELMKLSSNEDCETQNLDLDDLYDKISSGEISNAAGIDKAFAEAPMKQNIMGGAYDNAGNLYPGNVTSMMLSMPDGISTFDMPVNALLGEPIDSTIASTLKQNLKEMNWDSIQRDVQDKIKDSVGELVQAFDPFSDGVSVSELAASYASNIDLTDTIKQQVSKSIEENIAPQISNINQILSENSQTSAFSLQEYPFTDAISGYIWASMTSASQDSASYLENSIKSEVAKQKVQYISDPANKLAIQQNIASRLSQLGDLSTLDADLAQTSGELKQSQQALSDVINQLINTPHDPDLQQRRDELEKEIQAKTDELEKLDEKQAERTAIQNEQDNLDPGKLNEESDHAGSDANEKGREIFSE